MKNAMKRRAKSRTPSAKVFIDYSDAYNKGLEFGRKETTEAVAVWLSSYGFPSLAKHLRIHGPGQDWPSNAIKHDLSHYSPPGAGNPVPTPESPANGV